MLTEYEKVRAQCAADKWPLGECGFRCIAGCKNSGQMYPTAYLLINNPELWELG